jgi:chromosome segregation ATPase
MDDTSSETSDTNSVIDYTTKWSTQKIKEQSDQVRKKLEHLQNELELHIDIKANSTLTDIERRLEMIERRSTDMEDLIKEKYQLKAQLIKKDTVIRTLRGHLYNIIMSQTSTSDEISQLRQEVQKGKKVCMKALSELSQAYMEIKSLKAQLEQQPE